ncbi:DUF2911 domain-containing protein [Pareuzebyella sediminis]|uniref:DUF2911 domain-containing protein n=1 Tax=Pareuzebyella sediminis TaxID=2607998 RepID=UPI0011ED657D|nr:DUF2911 domain-containing protein [Pareuzebyella sediminis]
MKYLKWGLIVLGLLTLLFFLVFRPYMRDQTKKHSPEKVAAFDQGGFDLTVKYSSPSKKGRKIFGGLVPYDQVWRTGANEPTTFTTGSDIKIGGKTLPSGTYSLWTIPGIDNWTVIFNEDIPDWGVTLLSGGSETARIPEKDVLKVEIPSEETKETIENFTIDFKVEQELYMSIAWEKTNVEIPIKR